MKTRVHWHPFDWNAFTRRMDTLRRAWRRLRPGSPPGRFAVMEQSVWDFGWEFHR